VELLRKRIPEASPSPAQGTQTDENRHMLEAFRWNLRVLSYVSLAVGAFLDLQYDLRLRGAAKV